MMDGYPEEYFLYPEMVFPETGNNEKKILFFAEIKILFFRLL